ncbi:MAG: hypothetical protein H0T46_16485 [Deltaproteobacteria bacterium]|nr:hypothetical protein [Deltaproteobacteria bacterium]
MIGPDGHCKVCKRAVTNWGNERDRGLQADAETEDDDDLDDDEDDDYEDDDEGEDGDEDDDYEDDDDAPLDAIDPSAPAALGSVAEWNRRQVCPDGSCIGVIDDDGNCKVCGKRAPGARTSEKPRAVPKVVPVPTAAPPAEDVSTPTPSEEAQLVAAAADLAASLEEERKLCPDGACVGVIGSDGKCKLCGKEAA